MSSCTRFAFVSTLARLWVLARAAAASLSHSPLPDEDDPQRRAARAAMLRAMQRLGTRLRSELGNDPQLAARLLRNGASLHEHCAGHRPDGRAGRQELIDDFTCIGAQASMLFAMARDRAPAVACAARDLSEACDRTVALLDHGRITTAIHRRA